MGVHLGLGPVRVRQMEQLMDDIVLSESPRMIDTRLMIVKGDANQ